VEEVTWRPAPSIREAWLELADQAAGAHRPGPAGCWCKSRHQAGGTSGLKLVRPPWDESRRGETAPLAVTR
jgi:hypothetical protein